MSHLSTLPIRAIAITLTLAAVVIAATVSHAQIEPAVFSQLEALQASPEAAGDLVYRGATFGQRNPGADPLYRYERRVRTLPTGMAASHLTREPTGRAIIVESAVLSTQYDVLRFEVANQQSGFAGTVVVSQDGRHLEYQLNDSGKVSMTSEDVSAPLVCGPSLFGFILKNWESLKAGTTLPVRMLVLQEKTTYGFDIRLEKQAEGQATFILTPSSFLIRMAIAPLRVVFDATSKTPVRYEGRVPPKENLDGKLKDLDARVEYTAVSSAYR